MQKKSFPKPGNFLYPVPAVMVSLLDENKKPNIITVAWAGTVCSDPPMVSISVRKNRYSHAGLVQNREFVINLTSRNIVRETDFCGVRSGRDIDKFKECGLTPIPSETVSAPSIEESPVHIECKVTQILELGSHDMFLAEVTCVRFNETLLDETGRFHMDAADLVAYSHGSYHALGDLLGTFGYSVRKKAPAEKGSVKKSSVKKASANKSSSKKTSFQKSSAKKSSAERTSFKKSSAKKASAERTSFQKSSTKKTPAKKKLSR